jgi:hypothetical protein
VHASGVFTRGDRIDPVFKAQIPRSFSPPWAVKKYFGHATAGNSDTIASMVIDRVGAYSMATLQNVLPVKCKVAAIKNLAGTVLTPTLNAISLNILELASSGLPPGETNYDLTNPLSPNAWPICTLIYLWVDTTYPLTTCATKTEMLKFITWFYESPSVKLLADALNMAVVPDLFIKQTGLMATLESTITCQGQRLISSVTDMGFVEGFSSAQALVTSFTNYYKSVDPDYTYQFHPTTERLSTQRVVANEIDLALVNTRQLAAADVKLMTTDAGGLYVPAFFSGVAITFTLPTAITSKWAAWTATNTNGLPALYPLALNLETVAGIFVGSIVSWTDQAILDTAPQLKAWFDAYPTANPAFKTIVCCSSAADQQVAGQLLMQGLSKTAVARHEDFSRLFQFPLSWSEQVKNSAFSLLDTETRITPKSTSVQLTGDSSISYRLLSGATFDQTMEFKIVQQVDGVKETIAPEPKNFKACAQAGWDSGLLSSPSYQPGPIAGCYPLGSPLAFGINMVYEGDACARGNHSLNLFQWITNTDALSEAALNAGILRLADLPAIRAATIGILNSAICDGKTLLITRPQVWSLNTAIGGLGIAVMVICLCAFAVSAVILAAYHSRTVLRSSSVPFLALILIGLSLMVASIGPWVSEVTASSCSAFMWLANIGFSLVFVPFFAKTYRSLVRQSGARHTHRRNSRWVNRQSNVCRFDGS